MSVCVFVCMSVCTSAFVCDCVFVRVIVTMSVCVHVTCWSLRFLEAFCEGRGSRGGSLIGQILRFQGGGGKDSQLLLALEEEEEGSASKTSLPW